MRWFRRRSPAVPVPPDPEPKPVAQGLGAQPTISADLVTRMVDVMLPIQDTRWVFNARWEPKTARAIAAFLIQAADALDPPAKEGS